MAKIYKRYADPARFMRLIAADKSISIQKKIYLKDSESPSESKLLAEYYGYEKNGTASGVFTGYAANFYSGRYYLCNELGELIEFQYTITGGSSISAGQKQLITPYESKYAIKISYYDSTFRKDPGWRPGGGGGVQYITYYWDLTVRGDVYQYDANISGGKGDFKDLYIDKDDTKNGLQSDGYYYEPQDHYYIKSVISDGKTIKEIKVDGKTIQAKDIIVLKTEV